NALIAAKDGVARIRRPPVISAAPRFVRRYTYAEKESAATAHKASATWCEATVAMSVRALANPTRATASLRGYCDSRRRIAGINASVSRCASSRNGEHV